LAEVDFVVLENNKPMFAVECKTGERDLPRPLTYFMERAPVPHGYQVHLGNENVERGKIRVLPFHKLAAALALP
jgi:uncharacterized protein